MMSNTKRVLVIGGKMRNPQKAKALGLEVLYIQKKELFDDPDLTHADQAFFLDYENPNILLPFAKAIYELFPWKYVISMTESGLIPAALLNDAFNLPGNSLDTVKLLKDKWAMRQRLKAFGLSPVAAEIGYTKDDLIAFVQDYGLPIIVKPVDNYGSFGIFYIDKIESLNATWLQIQELGLTSFLMEEYLTGLEISVEAFSFSGKHVVLGITDKLTLPNFVEIGHSVPTQLDITLQAEVVNTVTTFLNIMGLKEGPSHTELKMTPKGPRIIESHNRVGGDRIYELVRIVYGVDIPSLAFAWPFGLTEVIDQPLPAMAGAAIRFFTPQPGIVKEISGLDEIQGREEVVEFDLNIKAGSIVSAVRKSQDRSGYLLTKGVNVQEAISTCDQLLQKVQIQTEPLDKR
jgi:biotin carboxylase